MTYVRYKTKKTEKIRPIDLKIDTSRYRMDGSKIVKIIEIDFDIHEI